MSGYLNEHEIAVELKRNGEVSLTIEDAKNIFLDKETGVLKFCQKQSASYRIDHIKRIIIISKDQRSRYHFDKEI